jgi:two-component system, NarL family, nitrate/nitrite response regulator NarL
MQICGGTIKDKVVIKTTLTSLGGASESCAAKPIRVLIADDHPLVRTGLKSCLTRQGHFVVVGEAGDGVEALALAKELSPHLVLMDLDMPKLNGLAATQILHRESPRTKVVILSGHNPVHCAVQILKSGARGCVSKDASTDDLLRAIETVARGGDYFSSEVAGAAVGQLSVHGDSQRPRQISPREREVLVAITDGLLNKEIASRLGVTQRTVETHRERIMRKLHLRNAAELTRFAITQGLIPLPNAPAAQGV